MQQGAGLLDHQFGELDDCRNHDNEGQRTQIRQIIGNEQVMINEIAGARTQGQHEGGGCAHADGRLEFLGDAHEGAQAKNADEHHVIDKDGADDDE
ncbi:hypothetical protein SDC9_193316 [bioreactor metagenome]|uniref:Uncharacterized protein n=1 Tax=bioreactor metagenome TaxID=1076179 RepID=A0A645I378_9ZZZZ